MELVTRAEAKTRGITRYFTGKQCKYGHVSERTTSDGQCIACHKIRQNKRNIEIGRPRRREWRKNNPEAARAGYRKQYYANIEKTRERQRSWVSRNKNKRRESERNYRQRNPDKLRVKNHNQRARRMAAIGRCTFKQTQELLAKQKFKCIYCRSSLKDDRHLDHIVPLLLGGANEITNLQWLCPGCNCRKGAKDPVKWAQETGRLL